MNLMNFTSGRIRKRFFYFFSLWVVYGCYYYAINRLNGSGITVLEVFFSVPVFALITYTVYLIADRLLARRYRLLGIAALLAFYVAVSWLISGLANLTIVLLDSSLNSGEPISYWNVGFLANTVTIISNYSLFGLGAYFVNSSMKHAKGKQMETEARLKEAERRLVAEREKKRFEFFMLAGQVSSHFIANLLDDWRLKLGHTELAIAESMERAYDLMVYFMEARQPAKRRVPLALEVERLENYVALTTGLSRPKCIEFNCQGDLDGYTIPPTSLLDLIENSTKHGRTDLPDKPIRIAIAVANNQLKCVCTDVVKDTADRESHGVGLANLRRRLELEYNDRFRLESKRQQNTFIAQLTINY